MNTNNGDESPEKLISQLSDGELITGAFEKLVNLGDAAVPALAQAVVKPHSDKELLYSVLSLIETDTANAVLTKELYRLKDKNEQALLALMLAKDDRTEIIPWLKEQLPSTWENGQWWRKEGNADSEFTASILAALVYLMPDSPYWQWLEESLESGDKRKQVAAEFVYDLLNEVDYDEEEN